jgi:uncharacterized protein YndB with AHSA1/START domain
MPAFELKVPISAPPSKVFAALTEPDKIIQWDMCRWAKNDMHLGGKLRKRDDHGALHEGEIVAYLSPYMFAILWPVAKDPDEPEEGTFLVRMEFAVQAAGDKSVLVLNAQGFPSDDLATRERNTWGGYFLEKIKKVAEQI